MSDRFWKVRVDCWYQPHRRGSGTKPLPNKCEVRFILVGPCGLDEAPKRGVEWAEKTAGIHRTWVSFELRGSSTVTFPLDWPTQQSQSALQGGK